MSASKNRLFHVAFIERLVRLDEAILEAIYHGKEANLFPYLYQVYAYIWTHGIDGCRLASNPNKERKL